MHQKKRTRYERRHVGPLGRFLDQDRSQWPPSLVRLQIREKMFSQLTIWTYIYIYYYWISIHHLDMSVVESQFPVLGCLNFQLKPPAVVSSPSGSRAFRPYGSDKISVEKFSSQMATVYRDDIKCLDETLSLFLALFFKENGPLIWLDAMNKKCYR